ncbi:MAG: hypothetical protein HY043_16785 [Verrucomicrobia bacterium]|nr:hypothetical protein [Verrucomicrobiota bacterium]
MPARTPINQVTDYLRKQSEFWRKLVQPLASDNETPFFIFSSTPIKMALDELEKHFGHLPVRHWFSFKTQPLSPLLRWWRQQNRGVEVVSEFEFRAALTEGFTPENILLNGPAKHHWLPRHAMPGLRVNFDSSAEARALAPLAKQLDWSCGVRLKTNEEFDPEAPKYPTQFGLTADEAPLVIAELRRQNVRMETVHFHLRTNVASAAIYERALNEVAAICNAAEFAPKFIDCGGGFPPRHVATRGGKFLDREFNLDEMARAYERALKNFSGVREIWLENGRWLTAASGVLVVKILDAKERRGMRHLICDGGKTMNALVSTWENHDLIPLTPTRGPMCLTTVNGPTCMAFDQLARRPLPRSLSPGDYLLWLDAGAYHLSWETHFSHGLAAVWWHDGEQTSLVRPREDFAEWWGKWTPGS